MSTQFRSRKLWQLILLVSFVLALAGTVLRPGQRVRADLLAQGVDEVESRNVLLLNSYHHGLSWTDDIVAEVRSIILDPERNPYAARTELYVEYMDTKRVPMSDAVDARWYVYLAQKYSAIPLDVIIVSDNDAYNFLLRHINDLFPVTPVVFCGINFFNDADLGALAQRFTGVVEKVDFSSTIEAALRLHPDAKRFVVVNDATTTGQAVQQELEAVLPSFEGTTFDMLINPRLSDLTQLSGLPADTLVLLVLLNRDGDGNFYTYEQSIDLLMQWVDRPIYGVWDFYLGRGLVGGMLTNAGLQGRIAGEMALELMTGSRIADLPIVRESPNRYMFDYAQLQRHGIRPADLPDAAEAPEGAETVVLNRPPPFLVRYSAPIGAGLAALIVGGGAFFLHLRSLRKQQFAASELQNANAELEATRTSMEGQIAARTEALERRSRQFQIAAAVAREVSSGALGGPDAGTGTAGSDSLLHRVAALISESFGYYHVGVFIVDEVGEYAVLRAASSPGGQAMVEREHRLRIGGGVRGAGQGIVGYVAGYGESRIALDVGADEVWRQTSELAATRSEMALPLRVRVAHETRGIRDWVIGVLDIQSEEPEAFKQDDVEVLDIVADQLALAIQTLRLFNESRSAVARLEQAYGERVREQWHKAAVTRAYGFDGVAVRALSDHVGSGTTPYAGDGDQGRLEIPIPLHGEVVGTIVLLRDGATQPWLPEERALAENIGIQAGLSLENAQLLNESQTQAHRQRLQSEIVSRMRETLDMDTILQTALREIGQSLGLASIEVRMGGGSND